MAFTSDSVESVVYFRFKVFDVTLYATIVSFILCIVACFRAKGIQLFTDEELTNTKYMIGTYEVFFNLFLFFYKVFIILYN